MIPVTSFAGKTVAVFGLGGTGRATRAGARRRRRAWSPPGTTTRRRAWRQRGRRHPDRRSARRRLARLRRAGAGARRAAHPSRAALDGATAPRPPASRSSATSSCSAASGGAHRARRAVHRHHRHQRQVDHHGADRPSPRRRRPRRRRSAAISARRSCRWSRRARGRFHVVECSSFQIDLAPSARPDRSASCSTSRPTISTGTARMERYAAHQGAAGRRSRRPP